MQLTSIRSATLVLALPLLLTATLTAACGQVTGLSDDYVFDLNEDGGGAAGDAPTDAPRSDAPIDAPIDMAPAPKCSVSQNAAATSAMGPLSGAPGCKSCLASQCCTDVDTCSASNECKRAFACRLACTTKTGVDRHDCFTSCDDSGSTTSALYTSGLRVCSVASCKADCGFP